MAESVILHEDQLHSQHKFFCHMCSVEIENVSAEYTCPLCASGFIEELPANRTTEQSGDVEMQEDSNFDLSSRLSNEISSILMSVTGGPQVVLVDDNDPSGQSQDPSRVRRRRFSVHSLQDFDSIVHDFLLSLAGGAAGAGQPMYFMGNPADYVYTRDGLDTIITHLLSQMDGTGPPPLAKDKIAEIPKVGVTEEQVNSKLQCSICWEDFQLSETVRRLPCLHIYHENCIVPWLELHGTCPVCRKTLNDNPEEQRHDLSNSIRNVFGSVGNVTNMYRDLGSSSSSNTTNSTSHNNPNRTATSVRRTRSLTRRQEIQQLQNRQPQQQSLPRQSDPFHSPTRRRDDDDNIDYEFD